MMPAVAPQKTLVFSIALNGYQWIYRNYLKSHREYARNQGYCYQAITRPIATSLGVECCWLKLTVMLSALEAGYERVMFVDADAYIHEITPTLDTADFNQCSILMAKGYSGRFNSGVIILRNSFRAKQWLRNVIASRYSAIESANAVGWGENGHIIELSNDVSLVGELNIKWNNTYNKELQGYITHFSHGPMRQNKWLRVIHRLLSRATTGIRRVQSCYSKTETDQDNSALMDLTQRVIACYPSLLKS